MWIEVERNTQSFGESFQDQEPAFFFFSNCFLQSDALSNVCERLCKLQGRTPVQGLVNIFIVPDQGIGNLRSSQEEMEAFPLPAPAPSLCNSKEIFGADS